MITTFKIFEKINQEPVKVGNFVYHSSNPINRKSILEKGLLLKKGEQRLGDPNFKYGKAIFATNSKNKKNWFDSTYDDDVFRIDTSKINNIWYEDKNMYSEFKNLYIITFEPILSEAIELIYKGSGNDKLKRGWKKNRIYEGITPKTQVQSEIDRLMDKGLKNLTPEEMEFLKNPSQPQPQPQPQTEGEINKYYQIAEDFFKSVIGRDIRNFDLNDDLDLWDIMSTEEEVYHVGNIIYYKYGVQIDPENNDDFKLVNIFKKISQRIQK